MIDRTYDLKMKKTRSRAMLVVPIESSGQDKVLYKSGETALVAAARGGHDDIVQLLSEEADPNTSVHDGNTALIEAARKGNCNVVELLLKKGVRHSPSNNDGNTALIIAAERGHYKIVQLLLNNRADRSTANYVSIVMCTMYMLLKLFCNRTEFIATQTLQIDTNLNRNIQQK
uniref:Uncharacterized protein n=1 Tax=Amphimedon queenslandica TaxID=400682 RepID=A0A1X7TEH4_AMPQE